MGNKNEPTIYHEYDRFGRHRLVINGVAGPWTGYQDPCFSVGETYFATTDYYGERTVQVHPIKATVRILA